MKNHIISVVSFLVICFSLYSQTPALTMDYLSSSAWGEKYLKFGYWLYFTKNGTFEYKYAGEGDIRIHGKYIINNSIITLIADDFVDEPYNPTELKKKKLEWQLLEDTDSLFSSIKIVSTTGFTFWKADARPKEGTIRKIDNIPIFILTKNKGITNAAVKVRAGPGVEFTEYKYTLDAYNGIEKNYIPNNYGVTILGRSIEKTTINGMTNYWYYCNIGLGWYDDGKDFGWIFGNFITFP